MFKQLGSFNSFDSCLQTNLEIGSLELVQNIEIFCKRNDEFDKVMVLWTCDYFWCWPSLTEYSSCDNHGCDWSLVFHWQAQEGTSSSHTWHEWQPSLKDRPWECRQTHCYIVTASSWVRPWNMCTQHRSPHTWLHCCVEPGNAMVERKDQSVRLLVIRST